MGKEPSLPEHSIYIRVPFPDVDSTQRIHFTAMLRYMEIAEHELRRSLGFPQAASFPGIAFPRVHISCDYRGAVGYDDELQIEARLARVGRSSYSIDFTARLVSNAQKGELAERPIVAEGTMTMVAIDEKTDKAIPLPEELRAAFTDI
jgi:acyl-CoA thioester hydrolase